MDSSVSLKDEIQFLRVCHHVSTGHYHISWLLVWSRRVLEAELTVSLLLIAENEESWLQKPLGSILRHKTLRKEFSLVHFNIGDLNSKNCRVIIASACWQMSKIYWRTAADLCLKLRYLAFSKFVCNRRSGLWPVTSTAIQRVPKYIN